MYFTLSLSRVINFLSTLFRWILMIDIQSNSGKCLNFRFWIGSVYVFPFDARLSQRLLSLFTSFILEQSLCNFDPYIEKELILLSKLPGEGRKKRRELMLSFSLDFLSLSADFLSLSSDFLSYSSDFLSFSSDFLSYSSDFLSFSAVFNSFLAVYLVFQRFSQFFSWFPQFVAIFLSFQIVYICVSDSSQLIFRWAKVRLSLGFHCALITYCVFFCSVLYWLASTHHNYAKYKLR